jgi:hypothetical protein
LFARFLKGQSVSQDDPWAARASRGTEPGEYKYLSAAE